MPGIVSLYEGLTYRRFNLGDRGKLVSELIPGKERIEQSLYIKNYCLISDHGMVITMTHVCVNTTDGNGKHSIKVRFWYFQETYEITN